jgi:methionine-rich copper-binding protein CopC
MPALGVLAGLLLATTFAPPEATGPTLAHSYLRRSVPEAGQRLQTLPKVRLEFSEPVEQVRVEIVRDLNEDGDGRNEPAVLVATLRPLRDAPTRVQASLFEAGSPWRLAPGAYVLQWVTLGADGHTVSGSVAFRVTG